VWQVVEYYHLDVIGSVRAVTDADGTVIARHDFRPFGEELSPQYPPKDRKLFTGQERDFETGLDYFDDRQLRVDLGRFTAPDPMADLAWTDPTLGATNAYGYVQNNPLGFVDPTGAWGDDLVHVNRNDWGGWWVEFGPRAIDLGWGGISWPGTVPSTGPGGGGTGPGGGGQDSTKAQAPKKMTPEQCRAAEILHSCSCSASS
jgi:RHS repeat-associated protein